MNKNSATTLFANWSDGSAALLGIRNTHFEAQE